MIREFTRRVYICDRCNKEHTPTSPKAPPGWVKLSVSSPEEPPPPMFSHHEGARGEIDLCNACFRNIDVDIMSQRIAHR